MIVIGRRPFSSNELDKYCKVLIAVYFNHCDYGPNETYTALLAPYLFLNGVY